MTHPNLTVRADGRIRPNGTILIEPAPTLPACAGTDGAGNWDPPLCWPSIVSVEFIQHCGYLDLNDQQFKIGTCSQLLYARSASIPPQLFRYESQAYNIRSRTVEPLAGCGNIGGDWQYGQGGPGTDPDSYWAARGPGALPCRATFLGSRPDGLRGPTWFIARAWLGIVGDNASYAATTYVPIDGDLLPGVGTPTVDLSAGRTQMVIRDHRGASRQTLEYDVITAYGKTTTPLSIVVVENGLPVAGAEVELEIEDGESVIAERMNLSRSAGASGNGQTITVSTDAAGAATVYLNTEDIYREQIEDLPSDLTIHARIGPSRDSVSVALIDNMEKLIELYEADDAFIPDGARNELRDQMRPPVSAFAVARWIHDTAINRGFDANRRVPEDVNDTIFCQDYQALTLLWLNRLRHDPAQAYLVNGIDYDPVQYASTPTNILGVTVNGADHHYVIVYSQSEDATTPPPSIRYFDPWPSQQATVYEYADYRKISDYVIYRPDTTSNGLGTCYLPCGLETTLEFYYPLAGGTYPYYPQNDGFPHPFDPGPSSIVQFDGCQNRLPRECRDQTQIDQSFQPPPPESEASGDVYIGSPVLFHLAYADGRSYGFSLTGPFENDFKDRNRGFIRVHEGGGEYGWMIQLPSAAPFKLTLTATATGEMSALFARRDGTIWGAFSRVPIVQGEQYTLDVDLGAGTTCPGLVMPDGSSVACAVTNERAETGGCGCASSGQQPTTFGFAALAAVLALARGLLTRRRDRRS